MERSQRQWLCYFLSVFWLSAGLDGFWFAPFSGGTDGVNRTVTWDLVSLKKRIDVSLCRAAPARSRRGHRRDPMSIAWAFVPLKILDPLEEDPIVVEIFRPKRPTRWFPLWTPRRQRERHGPWAMAGCRSPKLHRRPSSAPSSERHHFCTRLLWIKSSSATAQDSATRIPQLFGRIPQLGFRN